MECISYLDIRWNWFYLETNKQEINNQSWIMIFLTCLSRLSSILFKPELFQMFHVILFSSPCWECGPDWSEHLRILYQHIWSLFYRIFFAYPSFTAKHSREAETPEVWILNISNSGSLIPKRSWWSEEILWFFFTSFVNLNKITKSILKSTFPLTRALSSTNWDKVWLVRK